MSYKPTKSRSVLVLTTVSEVLTDLISPTDSSNRPEAILLYNKTKGGVDSVDKLVSSYSVSRGTRRWPLVIFFMMMNVAAINAYVIYRKNNNQVRMNRSEFVKRLSKELVYDHARHRSSIQQTPNKSRIDEIFPRREGDPEIEEEEKSEGKCFYCPPKLNRKTTTSCVFCSRSICRKDHTAALCVKCYEKKCL